MLLEDIPIGIPSGEPAVAASLTLSNVTLNKTYLANHTLTQNTVNVPKKARLVGGTDIDLKPNFSTNDNSLFTARIKPSIQSPLRYYYLKDHLGSIRVTVDQNGEVVSYDDYDPWGMQLEGRSDNLADANDKYKFTGKERDVETGLDYFGARDYDSRIGRWLQVDPLTEKYPGWSVYNYTLNNTQKFIDPNGKWIAKYNPHGNVITAEYQKGDTYKSLYTQLGLSATDFVDRFHIDISQDVTSKTFDITSYVIRNSSFDSGPNNSNCFGFVATAIGKIVPETQVQGIDFLKTVDSPSSLSSPSTGNIAVWNYGGNISNDNELPLIVNTPAHAAIFVLYNQNGEAQCLNRQTLNSEVKINTASEINAAYQTKISKGKEIGLNFPDLLSPVYYSTK